MIYLTHWLENLNISTPTLIQKIYCLKELANLKSNNKTQLNSIVKKTRLLRIKLAVKKRKKIKTAVKVIKIIYLTFLISMKILISRRFSWRIKKDFKKIIMFQRTY